MSEPVNVAYNMDCMEYMRSIPDKAFDLAVVDPPNGIGEDGSKAVTRKTHDPSGKVKYNYIKIYKTYQGGDIAPDTDYFTELFRVSKNQIIWGANHFISKIPYDSSCWIVWDKKNDANDYADCELAWTSFKSSVRIFRFMWNGCFQDDIRRRESRIHPNQKPVQLYEWIYSRYAKPGMKILDTHMGSGSSRIAAWNARLEYVGCEIDKHYFDLQEERFKKATAQGRLFVPAAGGGFEQLTLV